MDTTLNRPVQSSKKEVVKERFRVDFLIITKYEPLWFHMGCHKQVD